MCVLFPSCSARNNAVQKKDNNTVVTDTKSNIEMDLNKAEDKINEQESMIKGNEAYIKELENEIKLVNSITKNYPYKEQLSIAQKQWHYELRLDDKTIMSSIIETDKTDFKVILAEGHDTSPLVPIDVFNNGKVSGETKDHIKFNNYIPIKDGTAGTVVWSFVYEFKNVPHGTNIEVKISKELQARIGINSDIINIKVK